MNHILLAELNGLQHTDVVKARSIGTWQICHRHVNIFGEIMEETHFGIAFGDRNLDPAVVIG